jgi:hypothetical protein
MALQQQVVYHGLVVPEGYWRCSRFVFTSKTSCRAYFEFYASAEIAHEVNQQPLKSEVVDFEYDFNLTDSLHTQAYTAAKLMPEFAGAVDV